MSFYATITSLAWESEFFGFPIARLAPGGSRPIAHTELNRWPLLQARVASTDYSFLDQLSGQGFQMVEGEAELSLPIQQTERQAGIRIARVGQSEQLAMLASQAFSVTRFRQPWFSSQQSQQFYTQWVINALTGSFDDLCLVAMNDSGGVIGFITLRALEQSARIGLLAVSGDCQGQGVGQRLLLAATDWARSQRLTQLVVTTQISNLRAMRLYLRHGARLERTAYWLYRTPQ